MDARSVVSTKRDGEELSEAEIRFFLEGCVDGSIPDYQTSALLMAIYVHGMGEEELVHWTRAMLDSGVSHHFEFDRPIADKHSTGGVGDKVSLPLAPAAAACGLAVPMVSGRGLGHTGGTLDKLEAIPGLRTDLDADAFRSVLENAGAAIVGQTRDLVPADRKLYALRDVTGLVASIPLIASSILSKKLAEGIDALVLDVKVGSGAFLQDLDRVRELARTMLSIAERFDLRATAVLTAMDRPLGRTVGHALEVSESIACLRGEGPADLREMVTVLGGEMLFRAGVAPSAEDGGRRIVEALTTGSALDRFRRMVEAQGGDPRCVDEPERLPVAPDVEPFLAPAAGVLGCADVRDLGFAVTALGGGRRALDDEIDPAVGLRFLRAPGETVEAGDPIVELHHRGGRGLAEARAKVEQALVIGAGAELSPLILDRVEP